MHRLIFVKIFVISLLVMSCNITQPSNMQTLGKISKSFSKLPRNYNLRNKRNFNYKPFFNKSNKNRNRIFIGIGTSLATYPIYKYYLKTGIKTTSRFGSDINISDYFADSLFMADGGNAIIFTSY